MKCLVLKQFVRRNEVILPGTILEIPSEVVVKMAGYIQPLTHCRQSRLEAASVALRYAKGTTVIYPAQIWVAKSQLFIMDLPAGGAGDDEPPRHG